MTAAEREAERKKRSASRLGGSERESDGPKPREPREPRERKPEAEAEIKLDPRVTRVVKACLESMTMDEITPEFQKEMQEAFAGAISYEIETRLPLMADEWAPEIGMGCGIIGAGTVRFRVARQNIRKGTLVKDEKKEGESA